MRLEFHKHINSDISRIMAYYDDVAGSALADEFYAELKVYFQKPQTRLNLISLAKTTSDA